MTKSRIAEWILSQVLPPDRAASIIGDWMEDAPKRGNIWFWSCVFRTAGSCVLNDFIGNPATMARLGMAGFSRNLLVPAGYYALMLVLLWVTDNGSDTRERHDWFYTHILTFTPAQPFGKFDFTWPFQLAFHLFWAKWVFHSPGWIAQTRPGREFAGSIAVTLVGWTMILAYATLWLNVINFGTITRPRLDPTLIPIGIAHDVILFSGLVWQRRRQLHPVG